MYTLKKIKKILTFPQTSLRMTLSLTLKLTFFHTVERLKFKKGLNKNESYFSGIVARDNISGNVWYEFTSTYILLFFKSKWRPINLLLKIIKTSTSWYSRKLIINGSRTHNFFRVYHFFSLGFKEKCLKVSDWILGKQGVEWWIQ